MAESPNKSGDMQSPHMRGKKGLVPGLPSGGDPMKSPKKGYPNESIVDWVKEQGRHKPGKPIAPEIGDDEA